MQERRLAAGGAKPRPRAGVRLGRAAGEAVLVPGLATRRGGVRRAGPPRAPEVAAAAGLRLLRGCGSRGRPRRAPVHRWRLRDQLRSGRRLGLGRRWRVVGVHVPGGALGQAQGGRASRGSEQARALAAGRGHGRVRGGLHRRLDERGRRRQLDEAGAPSLVRLHRPVPRRAAPAAAGAGPGGPGGQDVASGRVFCGRRGWRWTRPCRPGETHARRLGGQVGPRILLERAGRHLGPLGLGQRGARPSDGHRRRGVRSRSDRAPNGLADRAPARAGLRVCGGCS
mmetsp:Transcript_77848/g.231931  ORF Transcript_77848/g.231931 Transcript_77848/m.231931 type:complete len:283 (+) Transcript_77848:290-1138(+)